MSGFQRTYSEAEIQAAMPTGGGDAALPGVTLHYATWGAPNPERAVVLIHGLTASHMTWPLLGQLLASQGHYVIAPDLRGRGRSGKPAHGYSYAFHAADTLDLMDSLGIARADIVGHSLGAGIGTYLAGVYPQRVRRLVMIDGGGRIPDDAAQAIALSVSRLGTVYPSLDAYLGLMSQLPIFTWNEVWETYFRYDATVRPDGTVVASAAKSAVEEDMLALTLTRSEMLPDYIHTPTLILRATVGMLGPEAGQILPRAEAERIHAIIPDSQLREIAGSNHYTIIMSDELNQAVASYLAQ